MASTTLQRLHKDTRRGQAITEYALILALIILIVVGSLVLIANWLHL